MLNHNFWGKYFKVYDVLNFVIPYQELLKEIIKEADVEKGDLVLDAGGGTGNLAMLLEKEGIMVVNLDFCKEALDIHKKKDPIAQTILGDLAKKLPFPSNYFDKVISNNVIYNIPKENRLELIQELKRVLKHGGKIVVSNLHKGFKPIKIYVETMKENTKRFGILNTIKLITKMLVPTIKMFYYNSFIQVYKDNLFDLGEQEELLKEGGFQNISETKLVFAKQAFLNSAYKL